MNTLKILSRKPASIPSTTAWYLADIGEAKGMQNLFTKQSPHILKALREHALIESAVSSNRIEGVEIEQSRIGTVIFGKPRLRDRNEEELRGYREERFEKTASAKGAKTGIVVESIMSYKGAFTMADRERLCPGVSRDMIKKVFTDMRKKGEITPLGRGPGARWAKKG